MTTHPSRQQTPRRAALLAVALVGAVFSATPARREHRAYAAAPPADRAGWRELFNGKDLTGWQDARGNKPGAGWAAEGGELVRKARAGDLWTKERFGDFVLDLEFKTKGNSGVLLRHANLLDPARNRLEVQILPPGKKPGKHTCGAIYDCLPPAKEMCKKDGWNRLVVTVAGAKVKVALNGEQVVDLDMELWKEAGRNPDGTRNKFNKALKDFDRVGHVGFQDHGAEVRFRNVRLKPLGKAGAR